MGFEVDRPAFRFCKIFRFCFLPSSLSPSFPSSLPLSPFCCSIPFIHRPQFTHFFVDGYLSFWLFHSHPEPISHRVSHFIVIRLFCNYEVKLQASYKLWLCVFCFCLLDPDAQWQLLSIHLSNRSWHHVPRCCPRCWISSHKGHSSGDGGSGKNR